MTFKIAVSAKKLQEMITGEQTAFSLKEIREFLEKLPGDSDLKEMAGLDEVKDIIITLLANALCERHIASQQKICNLLRSQAESLQSAPKNASGEGIGTETAGSEAAVPVTAVGTEPAGDLEDLLADDDFTDIPMDPVSDDDDDGWSEFCDSLNEELADCSEADDDAETADAPGDGAEGAADPEPARRRHRREFSKKHAPSEEEKRLQDLIRTELPFYKENHTLHFDRQVKFTSEDSVRKMAAMLNNPEEIARHSFYPLISSSQKTRQKRKIEEYRFYRKTLETATDPAIISLCKEQTEKFLKNGPVKIRPIRICSHLDSLIYARYSRLLEEKYEEYIRDLGISDSVIAYRKTGKRVINGVRVEFPNIAAVYDVVQFIRSRNCQCTALSVDLSSFFDSIDHQSLKEEWQNVLGVSELPPDHYNLFRSLTNYCYVEKDEIRKYIEAWKQEDLKADPGKQEPEKSGGDNPSPGQKAAGQKAAGERVSKGSGKTGTDGTGSAGTADAATGIAESAVGTDDAGSTGTGETAAAGAGKSGTGEAAGSRAQPEKESYAASFCKCFHRGSDFRRFRRWYRDNPDHAGFASFHPNPGLVKEGRSYGIPQGLSISSVLSNIYMIRFDQAMADFAREHGCLYRRYCDDILLVGPSDEAFMDRAYDFLLKQVEARGEQLKIHPYYKNFRNPYSKSKMHDFTSPQIRELPLQYLGFYFDGENVRIREASIAKFYREMQASVTALRYRRLGVANSLFQKDPGYLAANDLDKVRLICVRHVGEKELSGEIRQLIGKCSEEAARKIANRCSDLLRRLDDFTEESESRQRLSRFIIGDVDQKTGRLIYRRAFLPSLKKLHRLYSFRSTKSFMNYALNAAAVLDDPEHGRNTIRHQFRSHSTHLSRMVRRAYLLNCEELKRLVARLLRQGLLG